MWALEVFKHLTYLTWNWVQTWTSHTNWLWVNLVLLVAFILGAEDLIQFSIMGCSQWYSYMRFACNARDLGLIPWVGKIPWRRRWQPTPVFLPGESPWTEELGVLQPMGLQRVRHDWATKHSTQNMKFAYPVIWTSLGVAVRMGFT